VGVDGEQPAGFVELGRALTPGPSPVPSPLPHRERGIEKAIFLIRPIRPIKFLLFSLFSR
jgi:hypothetical protein